MLYHVLFITHVNAESYGLQGPEAYAYTSLSNCLDVQGIDDVADFSETIVSNSILRNIYACLICVETESYASHRSYGIRAD